jgi:hypothetical protein
MVKANKAKTTAMRPISLAGGNQTSGGSLGTVKRLKAALNAHSINPSSTSTATCAFFILELRLPIP